MALGADATPDDHEAFLREMYGNEPASWSESLTGAARLRVVVNNTALLEVSGADYDALGQWTDDTIRDLILARFDYSFTWGALITMIVPTKTEKMTI